MQISGVNSANTLLCDTLGLAEKITKKKSCIFFDMICSLVIVSVRIASPPAIYRAPKLGFPKTAAETAAETAGETRGAGGSAGGTAAETAGKMLRSSEQGALFLAVSAAVPPALPPAPEFPRQFPQQSPRQFGGIRAWGPCRWPGDWQCEDGNETCWSS